MGRLVFPLLRAGTLGEQTVGTQHDAFAYLVYAIGSNRVTAVLGAFNPAFFPLRRVNKKM